MQQCSRQGIVLCPAPCFTTHSPNALSHSCQKPLRALHPITSHPFASSSCIKPTGKNKSAQHARKLADSTSQAWLTARAPAGPGQQAAWEGQGSAGPVRMSPSLGLPGQQGQAGHPYLGSLGGMPGSMQVRHPCTGKLGLCSAQ